MFCQIKTFDLRDWKSSMVPMSELLTQDHLQLWSPYLPPIRWSKSLKWLLICCQSRGTYTCCWVSTDASPCNAHAKDSLKICVAPFMYMKTPIIFLHFKTEKIFLQLPGALKASDCSWKQGCHNGYLQTVRGRVTSCSNCLISINKKCTYWAKKHIFSKKSICKSIASLWCREWIPSCSQITNVICTQICCKNYVSEGKN